MPLVVCPPPFDGHALGPSFADGARLRRCSTSTASPPTSRERRRRAPRRSRARGGRRAVARTRLRMLGEPPLHARRRDQPLGHRRDGRLRLDAIARYLQDVASDDWPTRRSAERRHVWVVRRTELDVVEPFTDDLRVELETWCSGIAGSAAARRYSLRGDAGGRVEAESIWIHLDHDLRPQRLDDGFLAIYGAVGRRAAARSTRLDAACPPTATATRDWPLRATDVDRLGHVNNAAYWAPLEERLGAGGSAGGCGRCSSTGSRSTSASRRGRARRRACIWLVVGGEVRSAARLDPERRARARAARLTRRRAPSRRRACGRRCRAASATTTHPRRPAARGRRARSAGRARRRRVRARRSRTRPGSRAPPRRTPARRRRRATVHGAATTSRPATRAGVDVQAVVAARMPADEAVAGTASRGRARRPRARRRQATGSGGARPTSAARTSATSASPSQTRPSRVELERLSSGGGSRSVTSTSSPPCARRTSPRE